MKNRQDDETIVSRVDVRGNQAEVVDGETSVLGRGSKENS